MFNNIFSRNNTKNKNKKLIVFIGFNKTGTTSIHRLFQESGFNSVHWDEGKLTKKMLSNVINGKPTLSGYDDKFDVFSDLVYRTESFWFEGNSLFKQIDSDYENVKFVYNTRDIDDWLESRLHHEEKVEEQTILELHKKILDTDDLSIIKNHWRNVRERYEEDIYTYFANKKNFLKIKIDDKNFVEKVEKFADIQLLKKEWKQYNKKTIR